MFLPLEQASTPSTLPKRLFSRQATSQTLPPRAWASSEIAAVTLGVILGVILLVAIGYLANLFLRSQIRKIEQSVSERVKEELLSARERRNAALGSGASQERGPSGQNWRQQIHRRASLSPPSERQSDIEQFPSYDVPRPRPRRQRGRRASPLPPPERQRDIEHFPDYQAPRPHLRNYDQRETPPSDVEQIRQGPDSPYRGPLPYSTVAYHRAPSSSLVRRRDREGDTEALVDSDGVEMLRPRSAQLASSPLPPSRGRQQSRQQRDTEGARIDHAHLPRQSSLFQHEHPLPPQHEERMRYVAPQVSSANNSIQSNEGYEAGPE